MLHSWDYTFLLYINDLPDDVICNTTLYSMCDQASDLWQQLELASELESGLSDNVDLKWLVDFNVGKTQLVLLDWSNNTGAIYVKMDASVVKEKLSFKKMGLAGIFDSLSKCSQLKSFL